VTSWRIQLAAENLRSTDASIRKIAADIGYESEAAFNRAFKRVTGTTPGRWREGISPDPLATRPPPVTRYAGNSRR
jgi:AraC-like DNA-binding protein